MLRPIVLATLIGLAAPWTAAAEEGSPDRDRLRHRGPPPEAVTVCQSLEQGASCSFAAPHGTVEGTCRVVPEGSSACVPAHRRPPPVREGS